MRPDELEKVPQEIWQYLAAGDGHWRTPVIASAAPGGGADARTVVVRSVDREAREMVFFTDRRSRKLAQLQADPAVCLVVYDDERHLQARLYGRALRERVPGALDAWWEHLSDTQRAHYRVDVVANGLGGDNEKGRENFAAFRIVVDRFHCLWIHDQGNDAAFFEWQHGEWRGHPVRP